MDNTPPTDGAARRRRHLQMALVVFGVIFIAGVVPLSIWWPSGWAWHEGGRSEYLEMIIALYATLGVFLLFAAKDPGRHTSLIAFTVWSSLAHGSVMAVQALSEPRHCSHLVGDVPALFIVAAVLGYLCPAVWRPWRPA